MDRFYRFRSRSISAAQAPKVLRSFQTHRISAGDEKVIVSWRKTLGAVGGLLTGPSPPFDGAETWRKGARALPPVDRQLVEQEIFQTFIVAAQGLDLFPGQFQAKALHPKMTDLD